MIFFYFLFLFLFLTVFQAISLLFFPIQFNIVCRRVRLPTVFEIAMQMDTRVAIAIQMTTAFAMRHLKIDEHRFGIHLI